MDDLSGEIVRVDSDSLLKKTKLKHAWAITIHKFQGSESDNVFFCLSGCNENWRHVYTAVTRGKKMMTIIGTFKELQEDVKRKPIPRQTALREKIREMMNTMETPSKVLGGKMENQLSLLSPKESPLKRKGDENGTGLVTKSFKKLF